MKNFVIILGVAVIGGLFVAATAAQAQSSRLYFGSYLGLNSHTESAFSDGRVGQSGDIEKGNAVSFAGALGVRVDKKWRLEAEMSIRTAEMSQIDFASGVAAKASGDLTSWMFMLNGYYDFETQWRGFRPFATAGLGIVHHSGEIDDHSAFNADVSDDSMGYVWQLGGGVKYRMNPDLAFTGGYRYLGSSDIKWEGTDMEYDSHEFRVGLEYDLPIGTFGK